MDHHISWSTILFQSLGFAIALISCAIFAFLETSITAIRPYKIQQLASSTKGYKHLLTLLASNPHKILVTMLIANSLSNVTAAALSTNITEHIAALLNISRGLGFSIGIALGACAILVFGEIIPKSIAKVHGERLLGSSLWITNLTFIALKPLVSILTKISDFFIKVAGGTPTTSGIDQAEPEIRFLIEQSDQEGSIEKDKSTMLQSIFKICYKPVREIMKSCVDVVMLDSTSSRQQALEIFSKCHFSRLPVYEHDTDNIIGMIHQKDIFMLLNESQETTPFKQLVRPILFVPESMKVNQLLNYFKDQCMHLAMVTNEFGSITGLVTLEDVLEEIVGEIRDEYEPHNRNIVNLSDHEWLVEASIDLESLQEVLNISFETEMAATLGGFLTERLHRVPTQGQSMQYKQYTFTVQHASHKRVIQVLIQKK